MKLHGFFSSVRSRIIEWFWIWIIYTHVTVIIMHRVICKHRKLPKCLSKIAIQIVNRQNQLYVLKSQFSSTQLLFCGKKSALSFWQISWLKVCLHVFYYYYKSSLFFWHCGFLLLTFVTIFNVQCTSLFGCDSKW